MGSKRYPTDLSDEEWGLLEPARSRLPRLSYLWVEAGYRGRGKDWVEQALGVEVEVVNRSPKPPPQKVLEIWARE